MIVIATPTRDAVNATFAYNLVQLIKKTPDAQFIVSKGTLLCNQRTDLVKTVISMHATHILFIDSDMTFPPDTAERLLAHKLPIVGANCMQRGAGVTTAQRNGKFVRSKGKKGLSEVDKLGFGVTLIDMMVFLKMPVPWFATPYDGMKFVGEDIFFCHKAKENGFKIYIDHDLSLEIGHEGLTAYEH